MAKKVLLKGNEAIAEAAIRAGCRHYFGYPITPQSEIPEYLARQMPKIGGVFLQAESEVAAINMVYGAAGAGVRVFTSSSGPGISLMLEGISYIAGADLPCVIVNVQRAGPGLGGVMPAQGDYFQSTKGGGHGGYKVIVLAPASVQEMMDFTIKAFDLSDKYRIPVIILADALLGQMMEGVELPSKVEVVCADKSWATTGKQGRKGKNVVYSINPGPGLLEGIVKERVKKYEKIIATEQSAETYYLEDADIVLVAYGTSARVAKSVIMQARKSNIKVGMIRPITLWPFPKTFFKKYIKENQKILVIEMNEGQMLEDVKACVNRDKVSFYGKSGGAILKVEEIMDKVLEINEI